jgi:hypothetical protein
MDVRPQGAIVVFSILGFSVLHVTAALLFERHLPQKTLRTLSRDNRINLAEK